MFAECSPNVRGILNYYKNIVLIIDIYRFILYRYGANIYGHLSGLINGCITSADIVKPCIRINLKININVCI